MSTPSLLDRGIEIVQGAIEEDGKHNYAEALKLYQNSLDYFMLALKHEKNDETKTVIRSKINEFLARAETLKEHLTNGSSKKRKRDDIEFNWSATTYLDRGIEITRKAIHEDGKQNYAEAHKLYLDSLDYFILALQYEKNEKSRALIQAKTNEYRNRAEMLREYLVTKRVQNTMDDSSMEVGAEHKES